MKKHLTIGMMSTGALFMLIGALVVGCAAPTPAPTSTPAPTTAPPTAVPPTPAEALPPTEVPAAENIGAAAKAVDLIGAWVDAGAPETEPFDYIGQDSSTYQGTFEVDILPLFTENGAWFEGSPACSGCHFAATENSAHEMDLTSYAGILAGADVLSEPPGEPIIVAGDWGASSLRARLRNNRMPPGFPFDPTEANRNGPTLTVDGVEVRAVDLIGAWVDAGVPEQDPFPFTDAAGQAHEATFEADILPLFTENGAWFEGSQACSGCHFAISENSAHEIDLSSYAGILTGADSLSEPPGEEFIVPGDWGGSSLRARLRNNRMPPGFPFDPTGANRNGPLVLHGKRLEAAETGEMFGTGECEVKAVNLIGDWVDAGAPETDAFDFAAEDGSACAGTFEADILPLFTENGAWFEGSQACTGCHFAATENSAHEMDLTSYAGILAGADVLSEPPGEPIIVAGDWGASSLRARLRNNRMPPGFPFDPTEANRNGPTLTINGVEVRAVDLIGAWVDAGAPETEPFGEYTATFAENILPLFTENGAWFEGSQACSGCHFAISENSAHEIDLSSYAGILTGADSLSEPPGEEFIVPGDWGGSSLRARLRNNRMPPGFPFDMTGANRNGPTILAGAPK